VDVETPKLTPPLTGDRVDSVLALGRATERTISAMPRFSRGEMVRGRNLNPAGHTRLPRYARGRRGVITRHHGAHVFPDTNAHALGECPQHLYQVRFEACDLWGGPTADRSAVYLDLWDDYLEPV
jgi:nitrile hydratase